MVSVAHKQTLIGDTTLSNAQIMDVIIKTDSQL